MEKDNKELNCLITNEHVIKSEMIENKKTINIFYRQDNFNEKNIQIELDDQRRYIE